MTSSLNMDPLEQLKLKIEDLEKEIKNLEMKLISVESKIPKEDIRGMILQEIMSATKNPAIRWRFIDIGVNTAALLPSSELDGQLLWDKTNNRLRIGVQGVWQIFNRDSSI